MLLSLDQDYIPFGLRNNSKGDWKRENTFWNNLGQPAYTGRVRYATGRVRYERDYKIERTPSAQTDLSPPNQLSRCFPPHLGRPRTFTNKRERGRSHWRRLASRLKARGFGFHTAFSSLLSRYPNHGPRPIYMVNA